MNAINSILDILVANAYQPPPPESGRKSTEFDELLKKKYDDDASKQDNSQPGKTDSAKDAPVNSEPPRDDGDTDDRQAIMAAYAMQPIIYAAEDFQQTGPLNVLQNVADAAARSAAASTEAAQELAPVVPEARGGLIPGPASERPAQDVGNLSGAPENAEAPQAAGPRQAVQPKPEAGSAGDDLQGRESGKDDVDVSFAAEPENAVFKDLKAAPIKVAEPETLDAEAPDMDAKLTDKLTESLAKGEARVEIKLTPENLGSIKIELARSVDGSLSVSISASSDRALALLDRHSASLQSLLAANTQAPVEVEVQRGQESQQAQHYFDQESGGRQGRQQGEQQERRDQQDERSAQEFLQQLRLGLVDIESALS